MYMYWTYIVCTYTVDISIVKAHNKFDQISEMRLDKYIVGCCSCGRNNIIGYLLYIFICFYWILLFHHLFTFSLSFTFFSRIFQLLCYIWSLKDTLFLVLQRFHFFWYVWSMDLWIYPFRPKNIYNIEWLKHIKTLFVGTCQPGPGWESWPGWLGIADRAGKSWPDPAAKFNTVYISVVYFS